MSKHSMRSGSASSPSAVLQPLERLDALLAAALDLQPLLVEREARVALGEVEDPALVAALGHAAPRPAPRRLSDSASASSCRSPSSRWTMICAGIDSASA